MTTHEEKKEEEKKFGEKLFWSFTIFSQSNLISTKIIAILKCY